MNLLQHVNLASCFNKCIEDEQLVHFIEYASLAF